MAICSTGPPLYSPRKRSAVCEKLSGVSLTLEAGDVDETLAAQRRGAVPARVRVELAAGVPAGGAVGRGNMPPPLAAGTTTTVAETAQAAFEA